MHDVSCVASDSKIVQYFLSQLSDLNRRPAHYEGAALPTELSWLVGFLIKGAKIKIKNYHVVHSLPCYQIF